MDQKREQLEPMTREQIEAEAAFAQEIYLELSNPSPETSISESIKLRRRSKAAGLIAKPTKPE